MMNVRAISGGIIMIFLVLNSLFVTGACADEISQIKALVTSFDDPKMSANDLAFYLITHNYDAKPVDGHVELKADGLVYRLTPNGNSPGLCDISSD